MNVSKSAIPERDPAVRGHQVTDSLGRSESAENAVIQDFAEIILSNFNAWDAVVGSSARRELLRSSQ